MSFLTGKTGLAKLATIFAIGFVVSLGLCGANLLLISSAAVQQSNAAIALFVTAYLELAGMATCGIGLLFVGLSAVLRAIVAKPPTSPKDK